MKAKRKKSVVLCSAVVVATIGSAVVGRPAGPPGVVADNAKHAALVHFVNNKPVLITIKRDSGNFPATQDELGTITAKLTQCSDSTKTVDWYPTQSPFYKRSQSDPSVATFSFAARSGPTNGIGSLVIKITQPPVEVTLPTDAGCLDYPCATTPGGT